MNVVCEPDVDCRRRAGRGVCVPRLCRPEIQTSRSPDPPSHDRRQRPPDSRHDVLLARPRPVMYTADTGDSFA